MRYTFLLNSIFCYLIFTSLVNQHSAYAQGQNQLIYELDETINDLIVPSSYLSLIVDSTNNLTISEILDEERGLSFQHPYADLIILSDINNSYWVKFSIKRKKEEQHQWLLEVLDSHVDLISTYIEYQGQLKAFNPSGYSLPFDNRDFTHKNFVYPIPNVDDESPITFYFRYQSSYKNVVLFKLRKANTFVSYSIGEYNLLGAFYGILLILAIYNLFLYFSVRERFYIYYVLFVLSCMLIGFIEDSLGFQYLWPNYPKLNLWINKYGPFLFLFSIVLFSTSFLRTRVYARKLFWAIWASVLLNGIYLIFEVKDGTFLWESPFMSLPFLLILIDISKAWFQRKLQVTFFGIGYLFVLVGVGLIVLRAHGTINTSSILMIYAFNIGLILMVIFLSMALAERFKLLKEEIEAAQIKMIHQLKENERIIEQKVVERTEKIELQKDVIQEKNIKLEKANEELISKSQEINRLNLLLEKENEELQVSMEELKTARILMKEVDFEEFKRTFPDDLACYQYLSELKWENGHSFSCKKCYNNKYSDGTGPLARRCTKCGFNESTTNGTIFHRLHFPILKGFYMLFLVYANKGEITSHKLSEILQMRQNTCWKFSKKVKDKMEHLAQKEVEGEELPHEGWEKLIID